MTILEVAKRLVDCHSCGCCGCPDDAVHEWARKFVLSSGFLLHRRWGRFHVADEDNFGSCNVGEKTGRAACEIVSAP